jgi:hypothetical protein
MKLLRISDFFKKMADVYEDRPEYPPVFAAGDLVMKMPENYRLQETVNIAAGFVCWWRTRPADRAVWRITEPTAAYLASVGLGFVPEHPPASWSGAAIVAEAAGDHNLFGDAFSVMAYRVHAPSKGEDRYFFVMLKRPDGIRIFSITAAAGDLGRDRLLDAPMLRTDRFDLEGKWTPEAIEEALACMRFVFSLSYYILNPDRADIRDAGGPVERNKKGKPVKRKGRTVPVWHYRDLTIRHAETADRGGRGPLDKDGLALSPVIVSPYIRRHRDRVVIVDAHDSHRWKRKTAAIGEKRKV